MSDFFNQILTILTTSPGNLVYFLTLAFTIAVAFQISINQWRRSGFPQGSRLVIGLSLLLLVQLAQFIFAALTWQNLLPSHSYLPPLDRAVTLVSLVVITWLWLFPEPSSAADVALVIYMLLMVMFFMVSLFLWQNNTSDPSYNSTTLNKASIQIGLSLLGISTLLLIIRRPNGWGFGLAMNIILAAGYGLGFVFSQPNNDYMGIIRLSQMMAFPLLLYLPQRFSIPSETVFVDLPSSSKEVRRYRIDPGLVNEFLSLAANSTPDQIGQTITRLVSELMVADICLLTAAPDASGTVVVSCGYDLIKQLPIEGFTIDSRNSPILSNAMRRGRHVRLPSSSTSLDLVSLAQALKLGRSGHLLAAPVVASSLQPLMGIILLLPYSNRGWTIDDQSHLIRLCESLALILSQKDELNRLREEKEHGKASRTEPAIPTPARESLETDLRALVENLREQLVQERARSESLAEMVAHDGGYQKKALQLETEISNLQELLQDASKVNTSEAESLNVELRLALEEIARLNNVLAEADRRLLDYSSEQGNPASINPPTDVVASLAQDLRQPLSSIVVYTDLLLGESVGILGATQRKFVERIKASVERMGGLTEDLVHLALDKQGRELTPEKVDLNEIIDNAVAQALTHLRQQNIILRLDIPDQLPPIHADRDALNQILVYLLQNAGDTSPQEGEVTLSAQVEIKENEPSFVLIQVTDSGGGIPADDLPRVFSRLYRTDNAIIQGVGDTGVGLSVVKSLVEGHGGRIWVDSIMGRGATFSVLLPTIVEQPARQSTGN